MLIMIAFEINGKNYYKAPYNVRELKSNRINESDIFPFLNDNANMLIHFDNEVLENDEYYFEFRGYIFTIIIMKDGSMHKFGWMKRNESNMMTINELVDSDYNIANI